PAPTPAAKPAPTQIATAKPAPAPVAKPAPAPAKPAATAAAKPAEKPVTVAKAAGGTWYAGQAPGNYVVQILGTSSEASAQNFVKEQGGEYRYFKKVLNGKPLYVITYGNFANRDAALTAIKALPAKVQAGKPWPRTVASVQQELATTR
ncbi:SPOR domain-containing protein, partial [Pseudomonas sp. TNT3]